MSARRVLLSVRRIFFTLYLTLITLRLIKEKQTRSLFTRRNTKNGIGKKSLKEVTTSGVFHIPEYQRYYSWEEPEWDDLWTDLDTLPEGKNHYLGTLIFQ
jgi:uncharacterized protein with ParB-like and HNH nuclease domain